MHKKLNRNWICTFFRTHTIIYFKIGASVFQEKWKKPKNICRPCLSVLHSYEWVAGWYGRVSGVISNRQVWLIDATRVRKQTLVFFHSARHPIQIFHLRTKSTAEWVGSTQPQREMIEYFVCKRNVFLCVRATGKCELRQYELAEKRADHLWQRFIERGARQN